MIASHISLIKKYDYLADHFKKAYEFLLTKNLQDLPIGVINIEGDEIVAQIQQYSTVSASELSFETHDRHIDIQFIVNGREQMGIIARKSLSPRVPYIAENDITFYSEPEEAGFVVLGEGDLMVITPEEAHKPRCISGESIFVKKIVVKVKI